MHNLRGLISSVWAFVVFYYVALFLILYLVMKISFTNKKDLARGVDAWGSGEFGASRGGHKHNGLDLAFQPDTIIKAPFDLKILRFGKPYADKPQFDLIEFTGFGVWSLFKFKVMYVNVNHSVNSIVKKGEAFTTVQNISGAYGSAMTNHVHVEVRFKNILINPRYIWSITDTTLNII